MYKNFILISCILLFSACDNKKKEEIIEVEIEKPINIKNTINEEYNGKTEAIQTIQIKNRIDGFLESQNFKDGDYVLKGQLLFKIDDRILKSEIKNLNAQLKISEVNLKNLNNINEKIQNSFKIGGTSLQEKENSEANIEKEKANIELIKANIEKANINLSFSKIYAPLSGKIEKSFYNIGSYVTASGTHLTNLYQTDKLYFTVELPTEKEISQKAIVKLKNDMIDSKFSYCDPIANLSSGMIKCRYEINNKNNHFPINMMGKIILNQINKEGIYVKQTALIQNKEKKAVFVNKNGIAILKNVETGQWTENGYVEIKNGIDLNTEVIINGIANIKQNSKIKIVKE